MIWFKSLFTRKCCFCRSKIDHFGYRPEDLRAIPETDGDPRQYPAVERMMRRVGCYCAKCRAVYCAFCFAHGKRVCPRCHSGLPHPRGGGVYIDGINYFYGTVENLIAVLGAESASLWEFVRAYQTEFPGIDRESALKVLQSRLIAMVATDKLGISKRRKGSREQPRPGGEPLPKAGAITVLRDVRNWRAQAALEGRDYSVWLKAADTPEGES
jgi:hypothetical protein